MRLRTAAVGVAIGEAANDARELGGNNRGEFVRKYLASAGFKEGAPWCAAFAYWCALEAAEFLGLPNPLEDVPQKALVASYIDHARVAGWLVPPDTAGEGDIVAFRWPKGNHMGILLERPPTLSASPTAVAPFWTIEGNTAPELGLKTAEKERDGDGVYRRNRRWKQGEVFFIRWDKGLVGPRP